MENRNYVPNLAMLIDRLGIVTLKSVKIPSGKEDYEKEADLIMSDLDIILGEGKGKFIRAIQINAIINEMIWANESKARRGEDQDLRLLKLTHSLNRIRNEAMAVISSLNNDCQDLKSDYMDASIVKEFGYDFGGIFK